MSNSLLNYLGFATETSYLGGRLTPARFQSDSPFDLKADDPFVMLADHMAEAPIRRRIGDRYLHHGTGGEQCGAPGAGGASHRWHIDRAGGSKAFVYYVPIRPEIEGRAQVGVACFPAPDVVIAAASGQRCWRNGRRAPVSACPRCSGRWSRSRTRPALAGTPYWKRGNASGGLDIARLAGLMPTLTHSLPSDAPRLRSKRSWKRGTALPSHS